MSVEAPKPDVLLVQSRGQSLVEPNGHRELSLVFTQMRRRREQACGSMALAVRQTGAVVRTYRGEQLDDGLVPVGLIALPDTLPVAATLESTEHEGRIVTKSWAEEIEELAGLIAVLQSVGKEPRYSFIAEPVMPSHNIRRLRTYGDTGCIQPLSMSALALAGVERIDAATNGYLSLTDGLLLSSGRGFDQQTASITARLARFVPGLARPTVQESHYG